MTTGLDIAAGTAGLALFALGVIESCVSGIEILLQARSAAIDIDLYRSRLELDKLRLIDWANAVENGLTDPTSPKRGLNWLRIRDVLAQLELLLTDTSTLERTYHFSLDPDVASSAGAFRESSPQPQSYFRRIVRKIRPDIKLVTAQNIQDRVNMLTQVRWAVSGKTRLKELLRDIEGLIDKLFHYTDERDLQFLVRATQHLLRESLSRAASADEIGLMNGILGSASSQDTNSLFAPIEALGTLRAKRLGLGLDITNLEQEFVKSVVTQNSQKSRIPRSVRLKGGEIQRDSPIQGDRQHGQYQGNPVLLEWKRIPRENEAKLKHRVEALGFLLHEVTDSYFGNLPCLGFFEDIGSERYGFVYDLSLAHPAAPESESIGNPSVVTLSEALTDKEYPRPNFTQRMTISASIARYVRELHTVGWLHKAIRTSNVLFLSSLSKSALEYAPTYLAGFGYARAANPTEFSEAMDASPEVAIYCHPESLLPSPKPYQKTFDVLSLGMVLIEIGLWRPLWEIFSGGVPEAEMASKDDVVKSVMAQRQAFLDGDDSVGIMAGLSQSCPAAYTEAVKLSLWPEKPEGVDDLEESVTLQSTIWDKLETCCKQ